MKYAKQAWYSLIGEPFTWIFYSFFQPIHFKNIMEEHNRLHRGTHLLRLAIAVLLCIEMPVFLLICIGSVSFHQPLVAAIGYLLRALLIAGVFLLLGLSASWVTSLLSGMRLGILVGILGATTGAIIGGVLVDAFLVAAILHVVDIALLSLVLLFSTLLEMQFTALSLSGTRVGLLYRGIVSIVVGAALGSIYVSLPSAQLGVGRGIILSCLISVAAFCRVHFFLVSMFSTLGAFLASRKHPVHVFTYLHHSALYWDERAYFPLPGLKQTLLIAAEHDVFEALRVLYYIAEERPRQLRVARGVSPEILLRYLETCQSLLDIAESKKMFDELSSQPARLQLLTRDRVQNFAEHTGRDAGEPPSTAKVQKKETDPLPQPFQYLHDISKEAERWSHLTSRQVRMYTLGTILKKLSTIRQEHVRKKALSAKHLEVVTATWIAIAEKEQKRLESIPITAGDIPNPYMPGAALPLDSTLFVGRLAQAQQLETFLNKREQGDLVLLHAERQVGKTSFLKQLPRLLGKQYIPVLQESGMLSSAEDLLWATGTGIRAALADHDTSLKPLADAFPKQRKKSDVMASDLFDRWFAEVEGLLTQKGYTLLLIFDAFDELEELHVSGHLDLEPVLSWLHKALLRYSRLALLLSGVTPLEVIERRSGQLRDNPFTSVQQMQVPFLSPEETRLLVLSPISTLPVENIFPEDVIDTIITQTGGHPFLVQALCFTLIKLLNAEKRDPANVNDITKAAEQVLDKWDGYFRDLGNRTSDQQRACLRAFPTDEPADIHQIQKLSGLDERAARQTLQTLVKRSLVCSNEDRSYQMAAPMFRMWVKRYLSS